MANRKLTIEILGKDKTKNAVKSTEGGFKRLGNVLKSVGTIASGILASDAIQSGLNSLREGYRGAIDAAVDLGESTNAVGAIFGDFADQITTFGEESANALGLSRAEFQQLATPLGAMLKNSGMEMQNVTDSTIMLTERASDMASVFNTDVSEALSAVQAGLRGESDPLEQYGVRLSAAAVEAEGRHAGNLHGMSSELWGGALRSDWTPRCRAAGPPGTARPLQPALSRGSPSTGSAAAP